MAKNQMTQKFTSKKTMTMKIDLNNPFLKANVPNLVQ